MLSESYTMTMPITSLLLCYLSQSTTPAEQQNNGLVFAYSSNDNRQSVAKIRLKLWPRRSAYFVIV